MRLLLEHAAVTKVLGAAGALRFPPGAAMAIADRPKFVYVAGASSFVQGPLVAAWLVGPIAIIGCLYLFASLPQQTQIWFLVWNVIGLGLYLAYGNRFGLAGAEKPAAALPSTISCATNPT